MDRVRQNSKKSDVFLQFQEMSSSKFRDHPFHEINTKEQLILLLPHFLALSIAFPYLQSAASLHLIQSAINLNKDITCEDELTTVVGNYLSWDETGGAYVLEKYGKQGLHKILETSQRFHSNLLRSDLKKILGYDVVPDFRTPTKEYLDFLANGLNSTDPIVRCAHMVSFEAHAEVIIHALWDAICRVFICDKESLTYFNLHVGDEDPAEAYHVQMVSNLLNRLVNNTENLVKFLNESEHSINQVLEWSLKITKIKEPH